MTVVSRRDAAKISIKGYRGLKDVELELPAGLPVVLIGENASGKSTILDALAVLCRLVKGQGGDAIYDRGGWSAITWLGAGRESEFRRAEYRDTEGCMKLVCQAIHDRKYKKGLHDEDILHDHILADGAEARRADVFRRSPDLARLLDVLA